MSNDSRLTNRIDPSIMPLMRSLALELVIYGPIVAIYFFLVLRRINDWLTSLFNASSTEYAIASVLLIVGQGVMLEVLTSWLLRRIGLRH